MSACHACGETLEGNAESCPKCGERSSSSAEQDSGAVRFNLSPSEKFFAELPCMVSDESGGKLKLQQVDGTDKNAPEKCRLILTSLRLVLVQEGEDEFYKERSVGLDTLQAVEHGWKEAGSPALVLLALLGLIYLGVRIFIELPPKHVPWWVPLVLVVWMVGAALFIHRMAYAKFVSPGLTIHVELGVESAIFKHELFGKRNGKSAEQLLTFARSVADARNALLSRRS